MKVDVATICCKVSERLEICNIYKRIKMRKMTP